ncbi:KLH28 protein, partial [Erithacus rubecula]|nr:KLH28 protein [Erithacus rubecula]
SLPVLQMDPSPPFLLAKLAPLHSEQLLQGLNVLRQQRELCDVVLRAGEAEVHAHKVVLASVSPYFKAMFTGSLSEKENAEVEFQCVEEAALQAIVEYAYTGTVLISQDTVEALLPAANLLQVRLVVQECCAFLESQLDPGNCIGIWRFAETYGCRELCLAASKFICQNFEDVCQTEEFLELRHSELDEIVSNDCLNVLTEETVFHALEAWVKFDARERQKHLARLLHRVRLPLLSVSFLTRLYEANHLIRDDHTCKHLLNEALKYHFMPEHRLSQQSALQARPRCAPKVLCAVGGKAGLFACLERSSGSWCDGGLVPAAVSVLELLSAPPSFTCTPESASSIPGESLRLSLQQKEQKREKNNIVPQAGVAGFAQNMGEHSLSCRLDCVCCWTQTHVDVLMVPQSPDLCFLSSMERYDPSKNSWEPVASMADKRINFGVGVMLGFIFVVGGHNGVSHLSSIERYDPHQNQWTVCRPMKEPRTGG